MPDVRRIAAALIALLPFLAGFGHAQDAETIAWSNGYVVSPVSKSETGLRFELQNGNEGEFPRGATRIGKTAYVAAPPGSSVRWTIVEAEWREWTNGQPSARNHATDASGASDELPQQVRSGSARFVDRFRGIGMFACDFTVATYPARGSAGTTMVVLDRAVYEIVWEGGPEPATTPQELAARDPYLTSFAKQSILNPEQIASAWQPDDAPPNAAEIEEWNRVLSDACDRGPVVLLKATRRGIHAVSAADLASTGIDTTRIEASNLAAYIDGKPVPIAIENERSGPFVGDMSIWMDVPFESEERTAFVPVWLMLGEEGARLRLAMPERPQSERDLAPAMSIAVEIADPRIYDPESAFTERMGHWSTASCARGRFASMPFHLPRIRADAAGKVVVSLSGADRLKSQLSEVSINGTVVGVAEQFAGVGPSQRECEVPPGVLHEGENVLSIRFPDDRGERIGDVLLIGWAEVTAPVDPQNLPLGATVRVQAKPGSHVVGYVRHQSEARHGSLLAVDSTDPSAPQRLLAVYRGSEGSAMRFEITMPIGESGVGEFDIAAPDEAFQFTRRESYAHADLMAPAEGAEYLIVTHARFVDTLAPLVRSREARGEIVRTSSIDQIDACFGYGRHGYKSVDAFLRHAWSSWPGARLSRVLIVGEAAEYWWEMRLSRKGIGENIVPIYGFAEAETDIRGDDRYSRLSGSGPIPDIEIGRISVADDRELDAFRRKLSSYEASPPAGAWMTRHMFFTDDEAEFGEVADKIVRLSLGHDAEAERHYLQNYEWEDYFRLIGRKRSTAMTDAIVDGLSRGALTATYLGHGGPNLWSSERIFHYRDIDRVHNSGRFPIMTAASCNTAWIDVPEGIVVRSIGEQLLLKPNAGCIALFAPVSGTSSQEHDIILRPFFDAIVGRRFDTVGSAALYSKMMYMLERNQGYVPEQFVLLGDPMTRVPRPSERLALGIDPASVFLGESATVKVDGEIADMPWGTAEAVFLDIAGTEVVPRVRSEVAGGKFSLSLALPATLAEGRHRLVVHAWNEAAGRHERKEYEFEVLGPRLELAWSADPAPSVDTPPGTPVVLKLEASMSARYGLDNVQMRIRNVTAGNDLTSGTVRLEPGKDRQWEFRIPTPPGVTVLEASASFVNAAKGQPPIASSRVEIFGKAAEGESVMAAANLATATRLASPDRTVFVVPVFNMGTRSMRIGKCELKAGDALLAATSPSAVLAPGESVELQLSTGEYIPAGERRFDLSIAAVDVDTREEFNLSQSLPVDVPSGSDLAVVPGSVRLERRDYQKGETVYVSATIQNAGTDTVDGAVVDLYVDAPWNASALATTGREGIARQAIDGSLLPGEKRDVRLRWDPPQGAPDEARLYVVANAERRVFETVWSNNVGDAGVSFRRLPNLAIDKERARISAVHVRKGDVVSLSVPIVNDSPYDFAHEHVAEIDVAGESDGLAAIYREHLDGLASGESAVIQASWRADGLRDHIAVAINSEREYGESTGADNTMSFHLEYVSSWRALSGKDGTWDLARLFGEGVRRSVVAAPGGSLVLSERPEAATTLKFDNSCIVGDPLPEEANVLDDGLISILDGSLIWNAEERPDPVTFRLPLPKDDHTTIYDVDFSHLGTMSLGGHPTNQYAWSIEGETGQIDYARRSVQSPWIGRFETVDDFLDLTITPLNLASRNTLLGIVVHPVAGTWTSPWIELDGLRSATFDANVDIPAGTGMHFEFRTGTGSRQEPAFGSWERIESGSRIAARPKARLMQWRSTLVGSVSESPSLTSARILFGSRAPERADTGGGS